MKALSQQFDKSGNSMKGNKQKIDLLNRAIETNRQKLAEQRKMLDEATKKYREADTKTLKWKQTVAETEAELARLQNELKQIPNALQQVGDKMQQVGTKMTDIGKTLTTHLTLPIVALGTAAVKVAADFEAGMSKVKAISGATASEMDALNSKARDLAETSIFTASEVADGFSYMAMAGWKAEDMLSGIEGVMNLAAASGADLATTSDIVTDSLTAFGMSAEESGHLADIMAAAAANANTNVEMMGETFKFAAPIAGTLGVSMEDMAIATGLMANAGVKATNAGTALRAGLTRLAAPPKAAAEALNKYGIEISDTEGNMLSLRDIMENLRGALGDLSTTEQAAALNAIFGKNAISGWAAVVSATEDDFNRLTASIDGSSGAAKSMADTMKDNLKGELTMLKSQLESIGIEFGEIIMPTIKDIVKGIGNVVKRLKKLSPETKDLIVKLGLITAAAGPLMAIGGKFISGIGKIVKGIGNFIKMIPQMITGTLSQTAATEGATVAQNGLNAAMLAMPITAIVVGIGALVGALVAVGSAAYESSREMTGVADAIETADENNSAAIQHMNAFADSIRSTNNETQAVAAQAKNAADSIREISESGDTSQTAMARMAVAVQQLNNLFPDLGLELDRSTGKLNKSQAEIDQYVASAKKMGVINQTASLLETALNRITEATQDATLAQADLDSMMSKKEGLERQSAAMKELWNDLYRGKISLDEYRAGVEELDDRVVWVSGDIFKLGETQASAGTYAMMLEGQVEELTTKIEDQKVTVEALNGQVEIAEATAESFQQRQDALTAAVEAEAEAQRQQADAIQYSISNVDEAVMAWNNLTQAEQDMALKAVEAMTTLQTNVESALSSQMNMFEQFEAKAAMSTDTLLQNMQSQIEGVKNWETNLKELADRGIDEDLLQKLAAMGPEGSGYVETFKNMTAEQMAQANQLWKEGLNIQQFGNDEALELQTAIGQMSVGSEAAWIQLGETMGVQATEAGKMTGQGLIDGLQNVKEQVEAEGTEMGEGTIEAINTALGTHSPSTITTQSGKDVDMGLANGINAGKPMILAAINQVMTSFQTNFLNKLTAMGPQFQAAGMRIGQSTANGITSSQGQITSSINTVVTTIQSGQTRLQSQIPQWQNIGMMLCAGLAAGIAAGQSAVISAVAGVVAAAIAAAMAGLQIGSPSKVADKLIGRNFDAGIAQGLEYGIPMVQSAVKNVTAAMIQPVTAPQSYAMAASGGYSQISNDFGGTVINVYGAEGQNVEDLADIVMDRMDMQYERMQRAWAR